VKLLLDTHTVLWWLEANPRLGPRATKAISDRGNQCWLSAVSVFEIETKHRLGKLTLPVPLQLGWDSTLQAESWEILPVTLPHARQAGRWPGSHGDPSSPRKPSWKISRSSPAIQPSPPSAPAPCGEGDRDVCWFLAFWLPAQTTRSLPFTTEAPSGPAITTRLRSSA
jgi:PIN domain nuclease of toxin-antitoxin system